MKTNHYKIILITIITFIVLLLCSSTSNATATAGISASKTNVTQGDSVSINVSAQATACNLRISGSGIDDKFVDGSLGGDRKTFSKSYTLNTSYPGTYTVSLTGDATDSDGTVDVSSSVTVTVVERTAQPAQPSQPTQPQQQEVKAPAFTNTNKTMYTNGSAYLRSSWSTSSAGQLVGSGTEVAVTGISSEKVNGHIWYRVNYGGTKYIASTLLTDKKPAEEDKDKEDDNKEEKSTNKALKDIVIENYKLTPNFDPETTKYTVDVTKEVEKLEIKPILADDKSKFEITGNENFKVGNNIVKITVTAEDGTNRIYIITVAKSNKEADEDSTNGLKLSKLQIKDLTLDPEFKPETTNYSVIVSDPSSIKIADITAVAEDEDVEVTVAEAEADKNGNRVITIMLENKDGSKSGVYQITIKKGIVNPLAEIQNNKNKKIYFILGGIIGVLVIAIIVVIILLKKTSNKGDIQDVKDADELSDDYDYSLKNAIDTASSEEAPEYDEIIEDSNVKSQILTKPEDYNVFDDKDNQIGVSDETKKYGFDSDEDYDDDFRPKGKKKGKHF